MQSNLTTPTRDEAAAYIQGVVGRYEAVPALYVGQSEPHPDPDYPHVLIVWAHETYPDGFFQVMRWDVWREPDGEGSTRIYGEC